MNQLVIAMTIASLVPLSCLSASTITLTEEPTVSAANAAESALLSLANFESDALGSYSTLTTGAGTFEVMSTSHGGDKLSVGTHKDQFAILDAADSPFLGRYNTTLGGSQWLDSNDITGLELLTTDNTLWFLVTDPDDQGGVLTIETGNGTEMSFPTGLPNGSLWLVEVQGVDGSLRFVDSSRHDGYGLDDFATVASTPEPSGLALCGGLLAALFVGLAWRRRKA